MEVNNNWLQEPEKYYPPTDIVSVMKWHISLSEIMEGTRTRSSRVVDITDIKRQDRELRMREILFFSSLGYPTVARIETAMLIGRELCYDRQSQYKKELHKIPLTDLDKWAKVLNVKLSGGNLAETIDYTLSKRPEIWQAYVDAVR